jgi:hypothetical protein
MTDSTHGRRESDPRVTGTLRIPMSMLDNDDRQALNTTKDGARPYLTIAIDRVALTAAVVDLELTGGATLNIDLRAARIAVAESPS